LVQALNTLQQQLAGVGQSLAFAVNDPVIKNAFAITTVTVVLCLPFLIGHDRGSIRQRNASLTLPAFWLFTVAVPHLLGASAIYPLQDAAFARADAFLGFSTPAIFAWVSVHPFIATLLNVSYGQLPWLLLVAIFAPVLLGRCEAAWRFLLANIVLEAVAYPMFTMFPAVGPWVNHSFNPNTAQRAVEASIVALHAGHPGGPVAIVCFPSFHAAWAVLAALVLSSVRPLRVPAAVLAVLISVSTVTTGWHYAVDTFAGVALAFGSWQLACLVIYSKEGKDARRSIYQHSFNPCGASKYR
jgi:membrane-associated phospholipid phosphatase